MQADKATINRLLKTARGQIDGIIKMVEEDRYCMDISNQLLAADAILRKANKEVIRAHIKGCVKAAFEDGNEDKKIDELIEMMDKITK
ncbi:MAG: metal-sensing transcriptional repressor [Anaerotignaceae bacterium]